MHVRKSADLFSREDGEELLQGLLQRSSPALPKRPESFSITSHGDTTEQESSGPSDVESRV